VKTKLFSVSGVGKTQIYVLVLQMFASLGANGPKSTKATPVARRIVVDTLVLLAMLTDCDSPWYEDCASCDAIASGLLHWESKLLVVVLWIILQYAGMRE
jgi:hypothetical protein